MAIDRMCRIVVTGGAGFLGKAVCAALSHDSFDDVFVPRSRDYDLREVSAIERLLDDTNPSVVIHLAAVVGGIGANRANPGRYFYENAIMGVQLMEMARRRNVKKFVGVGTICSYPKNTPVPFREDDLWNGYPEETNAAYGLAKKMMLVQAQAYRQQYGMNAITLLPVNLYGPGDNFDLETGHVIPALIRKVVDARREGRKSVEVWGSGNVSREFLFVHDAAAAIALATQRYDSPQPMNIGTGQEITIRALVELICDIAGYDGELQWDTSKPDGQPRRCLDTTRAKNEVGFVAKTSLRDGLAQTIRWWEKQHISLPATRVA